MKLKTQALILKSVSRAWAAVYQPDAVVTFPRNDGPQQILTKIEDTSDLEKFVSFAGRMIAVELEQVGIGIVKFEWMPLKPEWEGTIDRFLYILNASVANEKASIPIKNYEATCKEYFESWLLAQREPTHRQLKRTLMDIDAAIPELRSVFINLLPANRGGRPRKLVSNSLRIKIVREIKRRRNPSTRLSDIFAAMADEYQLRASEIKQIWSESSLD